MKREKEFVLVPAPMRERKTLTYYTPDLSHFMRTPEEIEADKRAEEEKAAADAAFEKEYKRVEEQAAQQRRKPL
jgi:hypothetical protein